MLLAIDVRNTHTVVGLLSGSGNHASVVQNWRIRTEPEVTADELALTIEGLIGEDSERLTGATGLSTVPSVLHEVRVMLDQYWPSIPHVLIEPGVRTGIPLLVDNPKEVGADRIAANGPIAVQAIRRSARACLGRPEAEVMQIEPRWPRRCSALRTPARGPWPSCRSENPSFMDADWRRDPRPTRRSAGPSAMSASAARSPARVSQRASRLEP